MAPNVLIPPPEWMLPLPAAHVDGSVRTIRAVPFFSQPGNRAIRLDLHLPADAPQPTPLVMFIHGGAWMFGTRDILSPMYIGQDPFALVAEHGIAVASVDYRLSSEAKFPAQLHDVAAALRFITLRADELGIDPSRIAVWGESAGAVLANLLAFKQDDTSSIGDTGAPVALAPIAALIDWYGPSDLTSPIAALPGLPSPEFALFGAEPSAVPELAAAASPINHVHAGIPPMLLVHGTGDSMVPPEHSYSLAAALHAADVNVRTHWIEGVDHAWVGSPEVAQAALAEAIAFLVEQLEPA